tara:strand:+ start:669 stop:905 length:237 start_codon:yes stop_codon:yes gene_type:complete
MKTIDKSSENRYFVVWDENPDRIHFGKLSDGQGLGTGLANLKSYKTESGLRTKVDSIKGSGYYDNVIKEQQPEKALTP